MLQLDYNQVADVPRLCRRRGTFRVSVGVIIPHRNPEEQSSPATVAIVAGVIKRACHAGEDLKLYRGAFAERKFDFDPYT